MTPPTVDVGDDKILSIITWILLVTSTLAIIARLSTKMVVSRSMGIDDGLAFAALVGHAIAIFLAISAETRDSCVVSVRV